MVVSSGANSIVVMFCFFFFIFFSGVCIFGVYAWLGQKVRKLYEIPLMYSVYDYFSRFDRFVLGLGAVVATTFSCLLIPVVYRGLCKWVMMFIGDIVVK